MAGSALPDLKGIGRSTTETRTLLPVAAPRGPSAPPNKTVLDWRARLPRPRPRRLPGIFMDLKGAAFTKEAVQRVSKAASELNILPHVAIFVMSPEQEALALAAGYGGPLIRGYLVSGARPPALACPAPLAALPWAGRPACSSRPCQPAALAAGQALEAICCSLRPDRFSPPPCMVCWRRTSRTPTQS